MDQEVSTFFSLMDPEIGMGAFSDSPRIAVSYSLRAFSTMFQADKYAMFLQWYICKFETYAVSLSAGPFIQEIYESVCHN